MKMRVRHFGLFVAFTVALVPGSACASGPAASPSFAPARGATSAPPPAQAPATTQAPTTPAPNTAKPKAPLRDPDVIYVPTPQNVVDAMLKMANVTAKDVVYDLGSGDGRIPITAAQKYGARAVGIDINPVRIEEAKANLAKANVGDKVQFLNQDLFETDLSPATVITLYLLPSLNQKLIPKLKQLKPGTRIVSHSFDMGTEWPPEKTEDVQGRMIYYWTIK
jgi:16S rRNA G966 N2-methylase RsmD